MLGEGTRKERKKENFDLKKRNNCTKAGSCHAFKARVLCVMNTSKGLCPYYLFLEYFFISFQIFTIGVDRSNG